MTEQQLQNQILIILQRLNIFAWRANTGAARTPAGFVRFGLKGQADILGIVPPNGVFLAIECKSETGRQTPEQKQFEKKVTASGGLYLLANNLQKAEGFLCSLRPDLELKNRKANE